MKRTTALCALVLLGLLLLPEDAEKAPEPVSPYTLREYQGCVAVYRGAEVDPSAVTDIEVRLLPSRDRELLGCGLAAADVQELNRLLEDLGS